MRNRLLTLAILISACSIVIDKAESRPDTDWKPLFNGKDFNGWTWFFNGREKDATVDDLIRVEDGVIHIYPTGSDGDKLPFGYIATAKEYSYYHVRLEFKWGAKRFAPRAQAKRDSGMLYHVGKQDKVWPQCVEFQIQEGDTGDIYTVGTRATATVDPAKRKGPNDKNGILIYLAQGQGGVNSPVGDKGNSRVVKSDTAEHDGWNKLDLLVTGGSATQMVNGKVVNRVTDIQKPADKDKWAPLTAGRIAIQAEGAEVFFRNIEIRPLEGGPFEVPVTP